MQRLCRENNDYSSISDGRIGEQGFSSNLFDGSKRPHYKTRFCVYVILKKKKLKKNSTSRKRKNK